MNDKTTILEKIQKSRPLSQPCKTYYDAATQEILKITIDKLKIWLDECQNDVLKDKCNAFTSASNFIAVLGILITLIATLIVTDFPNDLLKAIYIVATVLIGIILMIIGYRCIDAHRKKRPIKLSDCVMQKIKNSSVVTTDEDI